MTAAEKLIAFIRNSFDTALYFAVMAVKENFRNYVGLAGTVGRPAQSMVILGNGPSLAGDMPQPRPGALRDARPQGCVADEPLRAVL